MTEKKEAVPLDRPVFVSAAVILLTILVIGALFPGPAERLAAASLTAIVDNASWYYVLVVAIGLISALFFAVTRFGDIKLGPDHAEPDYSLVSWFSMLFAAGMGIGLMFFGVAEPVMHFLTPPSGDGATVAAARESLQLTFLHWGLHGWAIYGIVAVILAYFAYRHGLPLTLRSALYPLVGERIYGPIGTAVDVFAIVSTTFGVATSLGFGVDQINSGLNVLFGVPKSSLVQTGLIIATTGLATISVVLGLDVGIRRLSEANIILAVALVLLVLLVGPTVFLLQMYVQNVGGYFSELVGKTFNLYAYEPTDWFGGWTIFYWGWWISWAPFVGLFIARISRGRTLREFVFGVLLIPTLFTFFWMTVFGNSAIAGILTNTTPDLAVAVQNDVSVALFRFFESLPGTRLISGIAIIMVIVFFVTSADSGAMVLNMLSSRGRDDGPIWRRVFWMAMIGFSAMVLLFAGGLQALQTATIASALPFSVAILAGIWGFARALSVDDAKRRALQYQSVATAATTGWRERLDELLNYPSVGDVNKFVDLRVIPAMQEFSAELATHGLEVRVQKAADTGTARLDVMHGDEIDFQYEVVPSAHPLPSDALVGKGLDELTEDEKYYRADVRLAEGSQDYCIMGRTREQIVNDIVDQYAKHLHFLHVIR